MLRRLVRLQSGRRSLDSFAAYHAACLPDVKNATNLSVSLSASSTMPSRSAYVALTPEVSTFEDPQSSSSEATSSPASVAAATYPTGEEAGLEKDSSLASRTKDVIRNNTGLLLVASAQAFFSFVNVAVKKLNTIDPPVPTLELVAVRMGITYICCITYMLWQDVPDPFTGPKGVRLLLVFRGFTGFFGLFGVYYSLKYLSLSDATVLTFLAPIFTGFTGAIFLKEKFQLREALAGFFSLIGVVLIARPEVLFGHPQTAQIAGVGGAANVSEKGTPTERLIAVGVALLGVVGATGAYTTLRAIGKRAHPLHSLASFSTQCVIVAVIGMLATKTTIVIPTRLDWLALLLLIGTFGFVAQVLLTMGLQRETAGRGTIAVYIQIVFATILERIFFKTTPSILSILGTIIIMTSALFVALTKENNNNKKTVVSLGWEEEEALEDGLLRENSLELHHEAEETRRKTRDSVLLAADAREP